MKFFAQFALGGALVLGPMPEGHAFDSNPPPDVPPEGGAQRCLQFRHGDMVKEQISVFSDPEKFEGIEIHYDKAYEYSPWGREECEDSPALSLITFIIDIATGQPTPLATIMDGKPEDSTYFSLALKGHAYIPLTRLIPPLLGTPVAPLEKVDGRWISDPGPFQRTGESLHGFERIVAASEDNGFQWGTKWDIYIREDEQGNLVGILSCNAPGEVEVPYCKVYEKWGVFSIDITFLRSHLNRIDEIMQKAHDFVTCLTL